MFRSRTVQITILAAGSALALITATAGDSAHGEGNLDAGYTISFARIPVGEITATAVFSESEYAMSAHARAGGVLKALLVDGEASFSTQGTIKDGHPVPTTFTSKIARRKGRPPLGNQAMSGAERARRYRQRLAKLGKPSKASER